MNRWMDKWMDEWEQSVHWNEMAINSKVSLLRYHLYVFGFWRQFWSYGAILVCAFLTSWRKTETCSEGNIRVERRSQWLSWGRFIETIGEENVLCSNIWKLGRGYVEEHVGCLFLKAIRTRIRSDTVVGLTYHQRILFCAYIQQALLVISCIWGTIEACPKKELYVHFYATSREAVSSC